MILTKIKPFSVENMSETQLLVGSLSNDLFRRASLTQRGSTEAAQRFMNEAKRWSVQLQQRDIAEYIKKIANEISDQAGGITIELAETYLMYGILLQNYTLHLDNRN